MQEIDKNLDGRIDEFYFELTLDLHDKPLAIDLILILDYKLHVKQRKFCMAIICYLKFQNVCPTQFETAAIFQTILPNFAISLETVSELSLTQSTPLNCNKKIQEAIIELQEDAYRFENVYEAYTKRNSTATTEIAKSI